MRRLGLLTVLMLVGGLLGVVPPAAADQNESPALQVAAASISAGSFHTCGLLGSGDVRCWGDNGAGQLGYGNTTNVGDGVGPSVAAAGKVPLGAKASAIAAGIGHTCALLPSGGVRCWGDNTFGQLGHGNTTTIGDGIGPSITSAGDVPLGGKAMAITGGRFHTCALLSNGAVRCWGDSQFGQLGHGNTTDVGDGIGPSITAAGDVPLGAEATAISAGEFHTCALLRAGTVRCWGYGEQGQLGHNSAANVGDGVGPSIATVGNVPVGAKAVAITAGRRHTCALLSTGDVRCWGLNESGQLGYGNTTNVGDGVGPSIPAAGNVPLGGKATAVTADNAHTCALLTTGQVRCWGNGDNGKLGYGNTTNVGDTPGHSIAGAGSVPLGAKATAVTTGGDHTCALLSTGQIRCWGDNNAGQLGYGDQTDRGDTGTTTPDQLAPVSVGGPVRTKAKAKLRVKKVKPDQRPPYAFKVSGSLTGAFPRTTSTCTGKVKLTLKLGKKKLTTKKVAVTSACRFKGTLKASRGQVRRPATLTVRITFKGNANLTSARTGKKAKAG